MVKNSWSRDWRNLEFTCWNPKSYSQKCHSYCKKLSFNQGGDSQGGIDVQGLTELHNLHNEAKYASDLFITSANAKLDKNGKSVDSAAGVTILLSPRMRGKIHRSGFIGSRIVWARLQGPICPIFYIVVYVPHKYRKVTPFAHEVIEQLHILLQSVPQGDYIIISGDFNCQLRRNIQGLTGKWAMTKRNEERGHDQLIVNLMCDHNLCS